MMLSLKKQKHFCLSIFVFLFLLVGIAALALSTTVYANSLIVDSLADTTANDGSCTLREAIINANNDDQSGSTDCTTGSGADSITFTISGTILLNATLPEITSEMTIDGAGVTVDGQNAVRVFQMASTSQTTISNITISGGNSSQFGGGIFNTGNLTLTHALLIGNASSIGGGGLHNSSSAVTIVQNSTFESNSGQTGGAIHNNGNMTITFSTFNGNIEFGGGAAASVADFGTMWIGATIFANSVNDTHCFDFGLPNSLGYNLSDDDSCNFFTTGDLDNVAALLEPLADNGGHTQTHALLPSSPAIDHIPAAIHGCGTTIGNDQRGVARPQSNGCDIGSFEVACPTFPVAVGDEAALNNAIVCYNALTTPGSYTISITADITLTAQTVAINNSHDTSLQINGNDHIIDGAGSYRPFYIVDSNVAIADLTLQNGYAPTDCGSINPGFPRCGGAIRVESAAVLTVTQTSILSNTANLGGGLFNYGGSVTVNDSAIAGNSGGYRGGGLANRDGLMTVNDSAIAANTASVNAGISNEGTGTITISRSTITGNVANQGGGGLYNEGNMATVINSTISGNSVTNGDIGGVRNQFSTMLIINSTIVGNSANNGGGLSNGGNALTVRNSIIANNPSGGDCIGVETGSVDGTNLDSDGTCGDAMQSANIHLGPLQDNGGSTYTHALLAGSEAINGGDSAICAAAPVNNVDQRGVVRPQGAGCDIGAYEAELAALAVYKNGDGSGFVGSDPSGIDCGITCTAVVPVNTVVTLTAVAEQGSTFAGWQGACTGTGDCVVIMDEPMNVTAVFNTTPMITYQLFLPFVTNP